MSRISPFVFLVCSLSGNAQFSSTVSESNSAENWKTRPNLRRKLASGFAASEKMSVPSTQT